MLPLDLSWALLRLKALEPSAGYSDQEKHLLSMESTILFAISS
jgi:hypothetical protein